MKPSEDVRVLSFTLPLWPSVNKCYTNKHHRKGGTSRAKSSEYRAWQKNVGNFLKKQGYNITGDEWLKVRYVYKMPIYNKDATKKKVDAANYEKALSDTLQMYIPWFEDHKILKMLQEKVHSDGYLVDVYIYEM